MGFRLSHTLSVARVLVVRAACDNTKHRMSCFTLFVKTTVSSLVLSLVSPSYFPNRCRHDDTYVPEVVLLVLPPARTCSYFRAQRQKDSIAAPAPRGLLVHARTL